MDGSQRRAPSAERLGYRKADIDDDKESGRLVQEATASSRSQANTIGTPKPPGAIAGQCRPHSTASSQPLSFEESQAPTRTNTDQGLRHEAFSTNAHVNAPSAQRAVPSRKEGGCSLQRIQGVAGLQDKVCISFVSFHL